MITDVLESIDLPDGSGSVVLFYPKCAAATDGQTLVRIDFTGRVAWRTKPSRTLDSFVGISIDGEALIATTSSGFAMSIDVESGQACREVFTR
ncbi:hypothetical protein [Methylopila sp. Yamaguchi]|uniref:hypothetical protein n=1 Tax=Methylopila sp. Yamaguchi TaxID=1437817 RepID=UPI000CAA91E3|nr:hypothetical protein [Methylopila sp. Yamaguchi]GBD48024.1 hypothetical protein METY_1237 [Methylopila sp. Yamaguchi]